MRRNTHKVISSYKVRYTAVWHIYQKYRYLRQLEMQRAKDAEYPVSDAQMLLWVDGSHIQRVKPLGLSATMAHSTHS